MFDISHQKNHINEYHCRLKNGIQINPRNASIKRPTRAETFDRFFKAKHTNEIIDLEMLVTIAAVLLISLYSHFSSFEM